MNPSCSSRLKKVFEVFDDYDTQLASLGEIVKILGGYPSESQDNGITWICDMLEKAPRGE